MMSASDGEEGSWKRGRSQGGCVNFIVNSDPNAEKEEGVTKPKILQTSYLEALLQVEKRQKLMKNHDFL